LAPKSYLTLTLMWRSLTAHTLAHFAQRANPELSFDSSPGGGDILWACAGAAGEACANAR